VTRPGSTRASPFRTWLIWTARFLALPLAGLAGTAVVGRVDSPVIIGAETDGRLPGGSDRGTRAKVLSLVVGQQMGAFVASEKAADPMILRDLIEAGTLAPAIDRTYPLSEVVAAIRHMLDGKARGKLAVSVYPGRMQTPDTGSTP
jgi:hypothetical protein